MNPNVKLSGLRSYRIEDNPEYMMLFPEVLDATPGFSEIQLRMMHGEKKKKEKRG